MTLSTQFYTLISMIGAGIYLGAAFDTYNRFLNRPRRKNWIALFNDIFFWLFQGLIIFYVLFLVNKGELRFYIFLALLCGFACYQSLLKTLYLRLLEFVISIITAIYKFLVNVFIALIYRPAKALIFFLVSLLIFCCKGILALAKYGLKFLLLILGLLFKPVKGFFILLWKLLPENVKKFFIIIFNKIEGFFKIAKNNIIIPIVRLFKRKK